MTSDVDVHSAGTPEHASFRDLNTTDASSTENTNLKMTTESLPYNTSLTTANIDTGSNDTYWIQEGKIYMIYLQKATKHSQGRIQDLPLGGGGRQPSLEGAPTSDTGAFR